MPYVPHILLSFRASLGPANAPVEEATFGLRFGVPGVANPPAYTLTQTMCDAAYANFKALIGSSTQQFSSAVRSKEVRGYLIGADGRILQEPIIATDSTPTNGSYGGGVPFQQTMVVSFVATGLGKGKFGRVYLPPQALTVGEDGLIAAEDASVRLAQFKTWLAGIKTQATPSNTGLIIASKTGLLGTNRAVTTFRMGRVPDTQRRRRRSLGEAYVVTPASGGVTA
jgi:hypothetical protein